MQSQNFIFASGAFIYIFPYSKVFLVILDRNIFFVILVSNCPKEWPFSNMDLRPRSSHILNGIFFHGRTTHIVCTISRRGGVGISCGNKTVYPRLSAFCVFSFFFRWNSMKQKCLSTVKLFFSGKLDHMKQLILNV